MATDDPAKSACKHDHQALDDFRDPVSGHFYFTYRCSKCGDLYGHWEDIQVPERPPRFGNYESRNEELYNDEPDFSETSVLVSNITDEIKKYLAAHPEKLYELHPRKFEELVAAQAGGAHKSMIVTTSFFTQPARKEQQLISAELDLKDYNDLKTWLQRYE
jgi:hypothetical protein